MHIKDSFYPFTHIINTSKHWVVRTKVLQSQPSHRPHVKIFMGPRGTIHLVPWRTLAKTCSQKWFSRTSPGWGWVDMWPRHVTPLKQPYSLSLAHFHSPLGIWLPGSPDVNSGLLPFKWHCPDLKLALKPLTSTMTLRCTSYLAITEAHYCSVQAITTSRPLLNASSSSTCSLCSHATPPGPDCCPAVSHGLPSVEALTRLVPRLHLRLC